MSPLLYRHFVALALMTSHQALAAEPAWPEVGSQPLAHEEEVLAALGSMCGVESSRSIEASTAWRVELESCEVLVDIEWGRLSVLTSTAPTWSHEALDAAALEARTRADLDLLSGLGFDAAELGPPSTRAFAARDHAAEGVGGDEVRILGSKTWVGRELDGIEVMGERVVITRDAGGALLGIDASWIALDAALEITVSDTLDMSPAAATRGAEADVLSVRPIVVLRDSEGGPVREAMACTEVTQAIAGPEGETRPSAYYVMDGATFNPMEAR